MLLRVTTLALALAAFVSADTLTLRSGRVIRGQYIGGDARHVKIAVGDRVDTYTTDDIESLSFGGGNQLSQPSEDRDRDRDRDHDRDRSANDRPAVAVDRPPTGFADRNPRAESPAGIQIPNGTAITVRMIEGVNSEETRLGQTFRASVDEPILADGQTVIPRGADAVVKLVEDQQSGKFQGRTVLTLVLTELSVNGRMVDATTADVSQASASRGARTAKVVGGTTALGAIIGAIAGGGKGAAIGAASGAAVGGTAQAVTKGQVVKIPAETRLTFTLQQPIQL